MKTFKQFTEELSLFEQPTKKKPGVYGQVGGLEIGTSPDKEQDVGYRIGRGLTGALRDLGPGLLGQLQGKDNAALQRQRARAQALTRLITTGQISNNGASTPAAPAASTPTKPQRGQGGRELGSTTQRQGGAISPTTQSDTTRSTAPAPAPRTAAKPFVKQTGDKAKDQATWAKANPTAVASEKKRKASRNPLMDRTFGYQTGQGGSTLNKASDLAALQAKAKADTISRSPNAARINRRLGL
jgi:hypothetical protein